MKILMTGNEAIARGAFEAGVRVVSSYPGTPSTEITENIARYDEIYCEWAPNEKVAMETAIGAAIGGGRAMTCMKHVGLNVAMDPLLTVTYSGINRGMVVVVADDPGMHSSQNEQDDRNLGVFAKMPILEPSDSAEAKEFVKLAFAMSEQYDTPVMVRITTRVAHAQSLVEVEDRVEIPLMDYEKNPQKYVMTPANARPSHVKKEHILRKLAQDAENLDINREEIDNVNLGIITSGVMYQYVKEALPKASVLKLGLTNPLPEQKIKDFAKKVKNLYVIEELDPVLESRIKGMGIDLHGKDVFPLEGEIFPEQIRQTILGTKTELPYGNSLDLPIRPPVLCAGCPHRGVFYVLKQLGVTVTGDIGCYTLGSNAPLSAMDTTICMGASIGVSHGMEKARGREFAKKTVAVLGDSTFIHSGMTGLINTVYNKGTSTTMILDNRITAMTGHQQNPLTGKTIKGEPTKDIDLVGLVKALGVDRVQVVDPFNIRELKSILKEELEADEPSVIIAQRPCELILKEKRPFYAIDYVKCSGCKNCLKIGCPAIENSGDKPFINPEQCVGCGLCTNLCGRKAMSSQGGNF